MQTCWLFTQPNWPKAYWLVSAVLSGMPKVGIIHQPGIGRSNLGKHPRLPAHRYANRSLTAMRHPGTAGSASAISPLRKITGCSGSLAL